MLAFAFFAFITSLIREIIKDAQDIEGDKRFGCRTLPVILGLNATRYLVLALGILTIATVAWFQFILYSTGYAWMAYSLLITQLLLIFSVFLVFSVKDKADWERLSLVYKIIMVAGMLSLVTIWFRNM